MSKDLKIQNAITAALSLCPQSVSYQTLPEVKLMSYLAELHTRACCDVFVAAALLSYALQSICRNTDVYCDREGRDDSWWKQAWGYQPKQMYKTVMELVDKQLPIGAHDKEETHVVVSLLQLPIEECEEALSSSKFSLDVLEEVLKVCELANGTAIAVFGKTSVEVTERIKTEIRVRELVNRKNAQITELKREENQIILDAIANREGNRESVKRAIGTVIDEMVLQAQKESFRWNDTDEYQKFNLKSASSTQQIDEATKRSSDAITLLTFSTSISQYWVRKGFPDNYTIETVEQWKADLFKSFWREGNGDENEPFGKSTMRRGRQSRLKNNQRSCILINGRAVSFELSNDDVIMSIKEGKSAA